MVSNLKSETARANGAKSRGPSELQQARKSEPAKEHWVDSQEVLDMQAAAAAQPAPDTKLRNERG